MRGLPLFQIPVRFSRTIFFVFPFSKASFLSRCKAAHSDIYIRGREVNLNYQPEERIDRTILNSDGWMLIGE
jgi:hypothetical protein